MSSQIFEVGGPKPSIESQGHEIVGRIEAVGGEATTLAPGTLIWNSMARLGPRRL